MSIDAFGFAFGGVDPGTLHAHGKLAPYISHLTSCMIVTSYILHLASYLLHPTSHILHPTSLPFLHLTFYILPAYLFYISHPTSYLPISPTGKLVKVHSVNYSVGLTGQYLMHVGLRQQGVALPGRM